MTSLFDELTRKPDAALDENDQDSGTTDSSDSRTGTEKTSAPQDLRTPQRLREATQELLKYGLLEESRSPNLYRIVATHVEEVQNILEPLDLALGIDDTRGLLFISVRHSESAEQDDDWSHPLVRRQRFNLEQSLLVAMLRQHFIAHEQNAGTGAADALVAIDDLIPQLRTYLGDPGSDAKERTRVTQLLDQLKGHGLVSAIDAHERVSIRPIIAHLANPENLQALVGWLRAQIAGAPAEPASGDQQTQEAP